MDPPDPILSNRARAELVAAMGCVCFVVQQIMPDVPDAAVADERERDLERRRALIEHVVERHRTG
jgi:hypothetical protein